ncbi:uncharacterized protein LOC124694163 [Lolium rigidum]|uniref:uncharacterized protein LOC124694163 n=1 Tax=Lolium rigidum TaxID=89674 RepID=UPI001F5C283A|nr:uncharacterized protein LOC124694163 [Lolium rigidum]
MLQAGSERRLLPAGSMWVPGMSLQPAPYGGASPSARALEIARRRDEMLGMLHGLPESDYELSLTDLVEKTAGGLPLPPPLPPSPSERKEPIPSPLGRPGWPSDQQTAAKTERRGSSRRRSESGSGSARSSFRSSSDSVLLNFYMPRSITRSFTAPRAGGRGPSVPARAAVVPDDSNKRERDSDSVKCWPMMPWDRRWRKSSRRDAAGGEFEAILKN